MSVNTVQQDDVRIPRLISSSKQAADSLRAWVSSEVGRQLWASVCPHLNLGSVCQAVNNTRAKCFGFLLCNEGAILWSSFSIEHFERLQPRYESAIMHGLCFWIEGNTFNKIESDDFLTLLRTLPTPNTLLASRGVTTP